ncbi:S8 family serine peptidase [Chrysiogenes arsenatis]|uniref:S8 family serine peptidase n=1 Tax=Chrysiogenes arsenatis TaxID=309797 RepID=UPI00135F1A5D|nr:S8 family serine peptidase [Chrysiogenes arsenatis]
MTSIRQVFKLQTGLIARISLAMFCIVCFGTTFAHAQRPYKFLNELPVPEQPTLSAIMVHSSGELPERVKETVGRLRDKVQREGTTRVIVRLNVVHDPEHQLSGSSVVDQRERVAIKREQLARRMSDKIPPYQASRLGFKEFETIPYASMEVDAQLLEELLDMPDVIDVEEDYLSAPTLAQSIPLIKADAVWASGHSGSGQTVAILDTGVNKNHAFLSGKVVSEACYSTTSGSTILSLCPGSVSASTAVNSGLDCNTAIAGCGHGTHVAGITAGSGGSFSGVAKDASIIAIQVFSRFNSAAQCGSTPAPCALSYSSDQIKALERVYALRNTYSIASANMSLGGGSYSAHCDGTNTSLKTIIDSLRAAGIATVIASGNNGYTSSISAPACISTAISVGSTTKSNTVSPFSNSAAILDLLAPGSSINSSISSGGYASWNGTSMATPHVAGAWAVLKSMKPSATVTEILSAFQSTGLSITDTRNGIAKPRIDVQAAANSFGKGSIFVSITPQGAINDGAQWQINSGEWRSSGTTVADVPVGSYTINFKSITHSSDGYVWRKPASITATIAADLDTENLSGEYTAAEKSGGVRSDFDGDGKSDIAFRRVNGGSISIWTMDGKDITTYGQATLPNGVIPNVPASAWEIIGTGDFDGDGKSDIAFRRVNGGSISIWTMDGKDITTYGQATLPNGVIPNVPASAWEIIGTGDFDGDGKSDIAFRRVNGGSISIWTMDGKDITTYGQATLPNGVIPNVPASAWEIIGTGDFDGDGKSDIAFRRVNGGSISIWTMDGKDITTYGQATLPNGVIPNVPASAWEIIGTGDFDGDGKSDIAFRRVNGGSISIWTMDGKDITTYGQATLPNGVIPNVPASAWEIIGTGDFDGDGKSDIAFRRVNGGSISIWTMDGKDITTYGQATLPNGVIPNVPASAWQAP